MPTFSLLRCLAVFGAALTCACSPPLNWREVHVPGGSVKVMLPCRADEHERDVRVDGQTSRMRLLSCRAAGNTFAVGQIPTTSSARAEELSRQLLLALKANVAATSGQSRSWSIPGMSGEGSQRREAWSGFLSDGTSIRLEAVVFTNDTFAYQVTVSGEQVDAEAVELFFSSLKVVR